MRVALLAGGTGGAKLAAGMQEEIGADLTVIANTGDDIETLGVHVSPDPDLVTYWLERRDRRGARLGAARRQLHRLRAADQARRAELVRPLRPRPRRLPLPPPVPRRGRAADRRPGADRPRRSGSQATGAADVRRAGAHPGADRGRAAARLQEYLIVDRGEPEVHGRRAGGDRRAPSRPPRCSRRCAGRGDRHRPLQPGDQHRPDPRRAGDARGDRRPRPRRSSRSAPSSPARSSRARPSASCRRVGRPATAAGVASLYAGLIDGDGRRRGRPRPAAGRDPDPGGADR